MGKVRDLVDAIGKATEATSMSEMNRLMNALEKESLRLEEENERLREENSRLKAGH